MSPHFLLISQKLERDGAVPLSNSISLADRRRIAHCIKANKDKDDSDTCPFRFGEKYFMNNDFSEVLIQLGVETNQQ